MTYLTPHFTLEEFTASNTADANGIENTPTAEHMPNIQALAWRMEQVRALWGVAIVISSGYRNPEVNALVGGVPTSAHALGYAADFHVSGVSDYNAATKIAASDIMFDQLIYEKNRCVHFSVDTRNRREVLSQPGPAGSPCYPGINP